MHYWLANVEELDGNVWPFKEIHTNDFFLSLSKSTQIGSIYNLENWLNTAKQQLSQGNHHPENLVVTSIGENEYKVNVAFNWFGITAVGDKMTMKTQHKWLVVDNPNERFARIKKMEVIKLEPLSKAN